jgi:hypothetical protein
MSQNQIPESPKTPTEEKDLVGIVSHDLLAVLYGLTPQQRIECAHQMNRWEWPALLDEFKPDDWETLGQELQFENPTFRKIIGYWDVMISGWEGSWYHWRVGLERTAEEHSEFWFNRAEYEKRRREKFLSANA